MEAFQKNVRFSASVTIAFDPNTHSWKSDMSTNCRLSIVQYQVKLDNYEALQTIKILQLIMAKISDFKEGKGRRPLFPKCS